MPWKTILTLVTVAALLRVPDFLPAFANYRVLDWSLIPKIFDFQSRQAMDADREALHPELRPLPPTTSVGALDRFYEALERLELRKTGSVKILHYGDSPVTADMISADARALLQKQFGDGGHGYHLIAKPWAWYEHRGVSVDADGWTIDPANQSKVRDGLYGLGGVSFRGNAGAWSRFVFAEAHPMRIDLDFLPGSGSVTVLADGVPVGSKELSGREGWATFEVRGAARRFEIRVDTGEVRMFGVSFTRIRESGGQWEDCPGIVYSSLGVNGAYIAILAKMMNTAHWQAALRHAAPDLVVINYGTNESVYAEFVDTTFEGQLRETIRRIRVALPEASILVMSPMDRGHRDATGEISTVPALHRVVNAQQRVAAGLGVGFFNTFEAMGGPGTMGRWYRAEPRLVNADFIHPTNGGAKIVGTLLYKNLMAGYQRHKTRTMQDRYGDRK